MTARITDTTSNTGRNNPGSKVVDSTRRLIALAAYVGKTSWRAFAVGVVLIALIVTVTVIRPAVKDIETALALVTLILVWIFEKRRQWIDSLPKTLTVHFWKWSPQDQEWQGKGVWEDAFLTGESDIRSTAQQLGQQLVGKGKFLQFEGHYYLLDENPLPEERQGKHVRRYVVHVPYRGLVNEKEGEYRLYQKLSGSNAKRPNFVAIEQFNRFVEDRSKR